MAISTGAAYLVWQQVDIALKQMIGTKSADSGAVNMFRALKAYLAQAKRNPDLQFVAFADPTDTPVVIADAACKVYAIFGKKQNTATDSFLKVADSATDDDAQDILSIKFDIGQQDAVVFYPEGLSAANGVALAATTTATGDTGTTSGDGPNGFVIIGKP